MNISPLKIESAITSSSQIDDFDKRAFRCPNRNSTATPIPATKSAEARPELEALRSSHATRRLGVSGARPFPPAGNPVNHAIGL
jgi:hypothetical protein